MRDSFSSISVAPYWESVPSIQESWVKQGQQAVNYIKDLGDMEGIIVKTVLLEGDPANELIRYAEEEKIDIVVMGTHGNTGLTDYFWAALQEMWSVIQKFLLW